jgi:hypothetical protein
VPRLELLDGDTNLLPSRHVAARVEASADNLALRPGVARFCGQPDGLWMEPTGAPRWCGSVASAVFRSRLSTVFDPQSGQNREQTPARHRPDGVRSADGGISRSSRRRSNRHRHRTVRPSRTPAGRARTAARRRG